MDTLRPESKNAPMTVQVCGGDCPKGGEHKWDGPEVRSDHAASGTCSKCGMAQIDHDLLSLP